MRNLLLFCALAVAIGVIAAASASSDGGRASGPRARLTGEVTFRASPAGAERPAGTAQLVDPGFGAASQQPSAALSGTCQAPGGAAVASCTLTHESPEGAVTAIGKLPVTALSRADLAVVGGTGKYDNAKGRLLIEPRGASGFTFTFELGP